MIPLGYKIVTLIFLNSILSQDFNQHLLFVLIHQSSSPRKKTHQQQMSVKIL